MQCQSNGLMGPTNQESKDQTLNRRQSYLRQHLNYEDAVLG